MASHAEKLRRKRAAQGAGRPRKQNVDRYPSGKIKPAETEKETQSVAIQARKRVNGWSDKAADTKAKDPRAGYLLGVLFLDGKITEDQLSAGDEYALAIARYHRLTGVPFPSARAQSLFSIKGHEGEVTESMAKRARDATNRMMSLQGILLQCADGPQVRSTIHSVAVMNYDHLRDMPPQQLLFLRRGLSALRDSGVLPTHKQNATDITRFEVRASA